MLVWNIDTVAMMIAVVDIAVAMDAVDVVETAETVETAAMENRNHPHSPDARTLPNYHHTPKQNCQYRSFHRCHCTIVVNTDVAVAVVDSHSFDWQFDW